LFQEVIVLDLLYTVAAFGFFAASWLVVKACDRL